MPRFIDIDGTLSTSVAAAARAAIGAASPNEGRAAPVIDALGDSITRQNGGTYPVAPPSGSTYSANVTLQSAGFLNYALIALGSRVRLGTNFGIGGQTTAQIYARLQDVLASPNPYVHVFGGVNDVGQNVPVATTKANLKAIYSELIAAGKIVTTATLIPSLASAGSAVLAGISSGVSSFSAPMNASAGDVLVLGSAGNTETVAVSSVSGSGPYTISLSSPTTLSHVAGEPFSNTTKTAMIHDINRWIVDYCQGRYIDPATDELVVNTGRAPFLVDWYSLAADPRTGKPYDCLNSNGTVKTVSDDPLVMLVDGTHPGQDLAHRMGHALAVVLDRVVAPFPSVVTDNSEADNFVPNPRCVGDTAGLATGFTLATITGTITATPSKVARTDGIPGEMQQIIIGPGNTGGLSLIACDTGATLTFTGSDYYVGEVEFETDDNLVSTGLAGMPLRLFVKVNTGSTLVTSEYALFNASAYDGGGSIWDRSGVFRTRPFLVSAAANRVLMEVQSTNVDTGTFRIKSMRFGKVDV